MKSPVVEATAHPTKAWLWKTALLACVLGFGTWLLLSALIPLKLPHDFPKPPDLQSRNEALRKLLSDADAQARNHPNSAEDIGRFGMAYHANQFYEQAESAYGIALRLAPADYRWPYCLAMVKGETGRDKEVHDLLQKTAQLKRDCIPALQKLADIYYKEDKLDEAARYYELSGGPAFPRNAAPHARRCGGALWLGMCSGHATQGRGSRSRVPAGPQAATRLRASRQ